MVQLKASCGSQHPHMQKESKVDFHSIRNLCKWRATCRTSAHNKIHLRENLTDTDTERKQEKNVNLLLKELFDF